MHAGQRRVLLEHRERYPLCVQGCAGYAGAHRHRGQQRVQGGLKGSGAWEVEGQMPAVVCGGMEGAGRCQRLAGKSNGAKHHARLRAQPHVHTLAALLCRLLLPAMCTGDDPAPRVL